MKLAIGKTKKFVQSLVLKIRSIYGTFLRVLFFNGRIHPQAARSSVATAARQRMHFAASCVVRKYVSRFVVISLFTAVLVSCQNPSVPKGPLAELPETLLAGNNAQRWYFSNVNLTPPFAKKRDKGVNGLATDALFKIRNKLIFSTFNGYLLSVNRQKLNDADRIHLARGISAPPAFYRPLVFVSAEKGKYGLQAYDLFLRKVIWKKKGLFSRSSPVLSNGVLFHATLQGKILAFDPVKGKKLWQYESRKRITSDMAMNGDTLIACTPDGLVMAVNGLDGSLLWKNKLPDHLYASPMILRGKVYLADLAGKLWALNCATGKISHQARTDGAPFYQPCTTDGRLVFAMNSKGQLFAFTPALEPRWRLALVGVPMSPVRVTAKHLLVATAQKYIYIIEKQTGQIVQKEKLKHRIDGLFPADGKTLYLIREYDHLEMWQAKGTEQQ